MNVKEGKEICQDCASMRSKVSAYPNGNLNQTKRCVLRNKHVQTSSWSLQLEDAIRNRDNNRQNKLHLFN